MKTNHEYRLEFFNKEVDKPFEPANLTDFNEELSVKQVTRIAVASEYSAAQLYAIRKLLEQLVPK